MNIMKWREITWNDSILISVNDDSYSLNFKHFFFQIPKDAVLGHTIGFETIHWTDIRMAEKKKDNKDTTPDVRIIFFLNSFFVSQIRFSTEDQIWWLVGQESGLFFFPRARIENAWLLNRIRVSISLL